MANFCRPSGPTVRSYMGNCMATDKTGSALEYPAGLKRGRVIDGETGVGAELPGTDADGLTAGDRDLREERLFVEVIACDVVIKRIEHTFAAGPGETAEDVVAAGGDVAKAEISVAIGGGFADELRESRIKP